MRICATYGSEVPLDHGADMQEIRLDVFDKVPEGLDGNSIITLCGKDLSNVPESFKGLVDVGDRDVGTSHRIIRSIHDYDSTPDAEGIVKMLGKGDQEISKGAFMASTFTDLAQILDASRDLKRKHVLLGMGEIGKITRLRQRVLGNEFTFGYVGESTAKGQFTAAEMRKFGDDCTVVGIIGHPLAHSKSPAMHNSSLVSKGVNGIYLTFDSESLDRVEDVIRGYDIRGVNVTIPYKQKIMDHLDQVSTIAKKVGAVNTVINKNGKLIGENTDVIGIMDALNGIDVEGKTILIMGSGGAARAAAYVFAEYKCQIYLSGRNKTTVERICEDFGAIPFSGNIGAFDIVVNCTPIGIVDGEYPVDITDLHKDQVVFDMVYGKQTLLLSLAKDKGCRIIDGQDMLLGQGIASFRMWFGEDPDIEAMRGALQ